MLLISWRRVVLPCSKSSNSLAMMLSILVLPRAGQVRLALRLNHGIADSVKNFAPALLAGSAGVGTSDPSHRGRWKKGICVGASPVKTKMELSVAVEAL